VLVERVLDITVGYTLADLLRGNLEGGLNPGFRNQESGGRPPLMVGMGGHWGLTSSDGRTDCMWYQKYNSPQRREHDLFVRTVPRLFSQNVAGGRNTVGT
jgi:hypothetical protein